MTRDEECPVCGSVEISARIGAYARCGACRLERMVEPVTEGVMENNRSRARPVRLGPLLRAQLRVARHQFRPGMGLVDFGCGDGRFLYHARRQLAPPAAYGVERSTDSVRVAVDVHGCSVVDDAAKIPKGSYLVTAWHVLEHLPPYDALAIVQGLRDRLEPGSRFIVSVPNADAWQAHLFGARWGCLEAEHHYVQFSNEALDRLLGAAGFVACADEWIALYGLYGTAAGMANLVVRPHNQAHRWLKRGGPRAGTAAHTALSLALAGASTPLTLGLAAAEATRPARRGAITRVYEAV